MIKNNQKGFTLFELTITFVLALIITAAATGIFLYFIDTWGAERANLEVQRQATYALSVMEKSLRVSTEYLLDNYENGKYHKISVFIPFEDKTTGVITLKNIEYYLDSTITPICITEKNTKTADTTFLCRGTYIEGGEVKSYFR
ncbi:MAG: prepilin-type N-terminal cleavage/methylation domain-containing protein, partial [Desulfobacterota bacterium]|nr:prepilin-type N-terminal cleavage/methylation domain-containing protein [Thermodesulfobacteriota bacterium]